MFRAARCSSSGGPIVSPQPPVSSPSVNSRTVCRGERTAPAYCTAVYRGWRYQRLWWHNWSSWWWAACCSKHVEVCSVTYVLLEIKRIVHQVGILKSNFYISFTVHLVMILGKWPTWRTFLFYVFISILYMFRATETCTRNGHWHRVTYAGCCIDTIDSPDDEHGVARNM